MREVGKRSLEKKETTACMRDDRSHIVPCRWTCVSRMTQNIGSSSIGLTARLCEKSASVDESARQNCVKVQETEGNMETIVLCF